MAAITPRLSAVCTGHRFENRPRKPVFSGVVKNAHMQVHIFVVSGRWLPCGSVRSSSSERHEGKTPGIEDKLFLSRKACAVDRSVKGFLQAHFLVYRPHLLPLHLYPLGLSRMSGALAHQSQTTRQSTKSACSNSLTLLSTA